MSRSFGKKPEALPEAQPAAMPDANAQTAPARPQFLKYGVVIGIFLFAATSILASNFALPPRARSSVGARTGRRSCANPVGSSAIYIEHYQANMN